MKNETVKGKVFMQNSHRCLYCMVAVSKASRSVDGVRSRSNMTFGCSILFSNIFASAFLNFCYPWGDCGHNLKKKFV